jgi:integrase
MTQLGVERLRPPEKGQTTYFDTVLPGLVLRVSYGGSKTWRTLYYRNSKTKYVTLGRYPVLTLVEAREKARGVLGLVSEGGDPKAKPSRPDDTVDALIAEFIERYAKPNIRTYGEVERVLNKDILPRWTGRLATDISRRDILDLMDAIIDRGAPYSANRAFAFIRKMFNWAVERGIVETSPAVGIHRPAKENSRDHVISDEELQTLLAAWDQMDDPWGSFLKVMLLTGQRRGEVSRMRWADLNLNGGLWTIPREFTKANRAHQVPLSRPVIDLLVELPRFIDEDGNEGEYVFTTTSGRLPIACHTHVKKLSDATVEELVDEEDFPKVRPWRIHDLRRTAATGMARLGTAPHVLSAILNHAPKGSMGVTAVYLRHSYDLEKRTALDGWARHLDTITGDQTAKVVPFRR